MEKRKQIEELYYIRAIAALGILIIHATGVFAVNAEFNSKAMYLGIFTNQFFRFGSPIFMMVSGLVLFYNYRSMAEFDAKKFYSKKALYIVVPYIVWSAIYFGFRSYLSKSPFNINQIILFLKEILVGNSFPHLYFMVLIVQFYLILPLLIKYLTKPMKEKPIKLFVILLILQSIILIYGKYFRNFNAVGLVGFFNKYYWQSIFGWFFYFLSGGILGFHYDLIVTCIENHIKRFSIFYIITTSLYVGQVYYSVLSNGGRGNYGSFGSIRPQTLIYAIATMPILIWFTRKMVGKFNIVKIFGTYSLGIYLAHPLILEGIKRTLFKRYPAIFGYSRLSSLFILVLLLLSITFLLVLLIAILKHRWILLGKIPQVNAGIRVKELQAKS